jgi:hypothetical protein
MTVNILPFLVFLIALILKIVGVHLDWITWLLIIGGLLLSVGVGTVVMPFGRRNT